MVFAPDVKSEIETARFCCEAERTTSWKGSNSSRAAWILSGAEATGAAEVLSTFSTTGAVHTESPPVEAPVTRWR